MKITGSFTKRVQVPALMAAAIALASTVAAPAAHAVADSDVARSAIGLKIAPVPLNLKGLSSSTVGLGSYLVNVGCAVSGSSARGIDQQGVGEPELVSPWVG
jgi:hypothetical protein